LDKGDSGITDDKLKDESTKLIKYFLASITVPEKDLWVNLSPYEKDRIIPKSFGLTEMGRDLLAEDYMLKQITASLIYPEEEVGKKFWKRIYEEAAKKYGTTNIPVNTFNKVWIIPEKAVVYENAKAGTAYVVESKLKVMLEEDYLSLEKNTVSLRTPEGGARPGPSVRRAREAILTRISNSNKIASLRPSDSARNDTNSLGSQIVREVVIPELTTEINEGKNFAQLRQVYNSLILATWYKKKIKDSILAQVYADRNKVAGVGYDRSLITKPSTPVSLRAPEGGEAISTGTTNPRKIASSVAPTGLLPRNDTSLERSGTSDVDLIYQRYLKAFKKGVYNYIKEEQDPMTQEVIPRKYFSGGATFLELSNKAMLIENGSVPNDMEKTFTRRSFLRVSAIVGAFTALTGMAGIISDKTEDLYEQQINNIILKRKLVKDDIEALVLDLELTEAAQKRIPYTINLINTADEETKEVLLNALVNATDTKLLKALLPVIIKFLESFDVDLEFELNILRKILTSKVFTADEIWKNIEKLKGISTGKLRSGIFRLTSDMINTYASQGGKFLDKTLIPAAVDALDEIWKSGSFQDERWSLLDALESNLPANYPDKRFFTIIRNRSDQFQRGVYSIKDLFHVCKHPIFDQIAPNQDPDTKLSIAVTVERMLKRFGKPMTDDLINRLIPYVINLRNSSAGQEIANKDTTVIIALDDYGVFDSKPIEKLLRSVGVTKFEIFKGSKDKEKLRDAIINSPTNTLVWFSGHGDEEYLELSRSGKIAASLEEWYASSDHETYKNLVDTLSERAKLTHGKLGDIRIVFDACLTTDFTMNILNEERSTAKQAITEFPLIIAAADIGESSFGGEEIIVENHQLGETHDKGSQMVQNLSPISSKALYLGDFYRAKIKSKGFVNPIYFVPLTPVQIEDLKRQLNLEDFPDSSNYLPLHEIKFNQDGRESTIPPKNRSLLNPQVPVLDMAKNQSNQIYSLAMTTHAKKNTENVQLASQAMNSGALKKGKNLTIKEKIAFIASKVLSTDISGQGAVLDMGDDFGRSYDGDLKKEIIYNIEDKLTEEEIETIYSIKGTNKFESFLEMIFNERFHEAKEEVKNLLVVGLLGDIAGNRETFILAHLAVDREKALRNVSNNKIWLRIMNEISVNHDPVEIRENLQVLKGAGFNAEQLQDVFRLMKTDEITSFLKELILKRDVNGLKLEPELKVTREFIDSLKKVGPTVIRALRMDPQFDTVEVLINTARDFEGDNTPELDAVLKSAQRDPARILVYAMFGAIPDLNKVEVVYHGSIWKNIEKMIFEADGVIDVWQSGDIKGRIHNFFSLNPEISQNFTGSLSGKIENGMVLEFNFQKLMNLGMRFKFGASVTEEEITTMQSIPLSTLNDKSKKALMDKFASDDASRNEKLANALGFDSFERMRASLQSKKAVKAGSRTSAQETNRAMNGQEKRGGIDLTSNQFLQTQNSGGGEIKFHIDSAMLSQLQSSPGFEARVISIQPLESVPEFLGINQKLGTK